MTATRFERWLCKRLGVTPSGLKTLAKGAACGGSVGGAGMGHASIGARGKLHADGFVDELGMITEAGHEVIRQAREAGW